MCSVNNSQQSPRYWQNGANFISHKKGEDHLPDGPNKDKVSLIIDSSSNTTDKIVQLGRSKEDHLPNHSIKEKVSPMIDSSSATTDKIVQLGQSRFPQPAVSGCKGVGGWITFAVGTALPPGNSNKMNGGGTVLIGEDITMGALEFVQAAARLKVAVVEGCKEEILKGIGELITNLSLMIGGALFFAFRLLEGLSTSVSAKLSHVFDSIAKAMSKPGLICFEVFFSALALLSVDKLVGHFQFTKTLDKENWFELIQQEIQNGNDLAKKQGLMDRLLNIGIEARVGKMNMEKIQDFLKKESIENLELNELKKAIKAENTKNKVIAVIKTALAILGIIAVALHFISCPAVALLAITVILCATSIAMSLYHMQAGWVKEAHNPHDKKWVIFYAVLTLLNLIFTILLSHFALHIDLESLIAPCVTGGIMLSLYSLNYYKLHQRELAWNEWKGQSMQDASKGVSPNSGTVQANTNPNE